MNISAPGYALCRTTYKSILGEKARVVSTTCDLDGTIVPLQNAQDWPGLGRYLSEKVKELAQQGADFVIMPANSVHFAYDHIEKPIPVLNLVEIVANTCAQQGYTHAAILGVQFTMQGHLYRNALQQNGIKECVPTEEDQTVLEHVIREQILKDKTPNTAQVLDIMRRMRTSGCDVAILACTELPLIVNEMNAPMPYIDSTRLLAKDAAAYALLCTSQP